MEKSVIYMYTKYGFRSTVSGITNDFKVLMSGGRMVGVVHLKCKRHNKVHVGDHGFEFQATKNGLISMKRSVFT